REVQRDDCSLASRVAISFDDNGGSMLFKIRAGFRIASKRAMLCRGNACRGHQLFGKGFATFEGSSVSSWAKDTQSSLTKEISNTTYQRYFGSYDSEIDLGTPGEIRQFGKLCCVEWHTFSIRAHARIARCRI